MPKLGRLFPPFAAPAPRPRGSKLQNIGLRLTFRVARYPNETLGQKIKKLRLERGMRQVELAKALGVNEDTMKIWERGKARPSGELLRRTDGYFREKLLIRHGQGP